LILDEDFSIFIHIVGVVLWTIAFPHTEEVIAIVVGIVHRTKTVFFYTFNDCAVLVVWTVPPIHRAMEMLTFHCHRLLTLCIIAQVTPEVNHQNAQNREKIFVEVFSQNRLTKWLAGGIIEISARAHASGPPIIHLIVDFVKWALCTKIGLRISQPET
jgi:hypothetical protein